MKIYFEEYSYPINLLPESLGSNINLSYNKDKSMAKIPYVGYYFNAEIQDTVFIMPKVFISETNMAFNQYIPTEIIDLSPENNPLKEEENDEVVFELSAWLYQAISHFFDRKQESNIGSDIQIHKVRPLGEKGSKTIIEIILSLREFQKKHHNLFTYISLIKSSGNNKVHWTKTISKVQPVFKEDTPYYLEFRNKKKVINFDEELITLFYSVLNYLAQTYHFKFQIVQGYTLMRPSKIKSLIESNKGTRLLKKIRRNYFTDELVELWNLLYEFFEREEIIGSGKPYQEKLLVSNFNLVFEDMIDQLISDNRKDIPSELWEQQDGKVVDHIYKDQSIIEDNRQIYYIGDSKYYKETTTLGPNSIYKQFTYAKNVIQYNINVFNNEQDDSVFRYRDSLTEGYNITPNFFIRGTIDFNNPRNQDPNISEPQAVEPHNIHFANRLFDRDSLFLLSYNINFMFVIASYVNNSNDAALKKSIQAMFRHDFLKFIESRFDFSILKPKRGDIKDAVERNFKKLNGKIYQPSDVKNLLILALDKKYQLENLQLISQIEDDFYIYDYQLGNNPEETMRKVKYHYWEIPETKAAESIEQNNTKNTISIQPIKYEKLKQTSVLFGVFKDQKHLEWIQNNKKYNVRLGERVGAVKRTRQVTSAEYLVLYEFQNERNYRVYKLSDKHFIWDTNKMRESGYPISENSESRLYYIYNLLEETDELGSIDIESTLFAPREMIAKQTKNEDDIKATPIYVYKNEVYHF